MINLIPPKAKKDLLVEYWARVVSVWLMLISGALLVGSILLIPVYVLIENHISINKDQSSEVLLQVEEFDQLSESINYSNKEAIFMVNESDLPVLSEVIETFKSLESNDIQIAAISVGREGTGLRSVKISGIADDRLALSGYRDSLEAEEIVKDVDLPISNLAKDKDIFFNLTLSMNNE